MPPKNAKDSNKNQKPVDDESGIPKNDVSFKFSFQVKQNEIENIQIMFEWINPSDLSGRLKYDTDLIESWDQVNPDDPSLLNYEMELPSLRVEDKFAKNICSGKFYIHFVSTEDQMVKDSVYLHYSPLLTAKSEYKFEYSHDKLKIPQIESFKITVTADKELLTPMFKDYLNPLEICIVGTKEMPTNLSTLNRYEPVYIQAKFFDGTIIKTHELPHSSTCKWMYRQVVLAGLMNPIQLMEYLRTSPLQFEIHDQDEVAKNDIRDFKQLVDVKYEEPEPPVEVDPKTKAKGAPGKKAEPPVEQKKKEEKPKEAKGKDAKGKKDPKKKKDTKSFEPIKQEDTREIIKINYGVSYFNLNDLLNPHLNSVKLRNYIVPLQEYENKELTNLDLNTTARKEQQEVRITSDYLNNESYLVVKFEIAHAIRFFKKPNPSEVPAEIQAKENPKQAAKSNPAPQKDAKIASQVEIGSSSGAAEEEKPVFERAIYIFPYKSPEWTPKLQNIVEEVNMKAFPAANGNALFLATKTLSEEEKKNKNLDIITGLEFIDNKYRMFILEGLAEGSMRRLENELPKNDPNSRDFKILRNSDFRFKERLYWDCNLEVKKIRFRENLTKLLKRPEIYIRSKVPEHVCDVLNILSELRKCDNLKVVIASNLFPNLEDILSTERKYGDALTDEDVTGFESSPQKKVTRTVTKLPKIESDWSSMQSPRSPKESSITFKQSSRVTNDHVSLERDPGQKKHNGYYSMPTKLATKFDNPKYDKYSLHLTKLYPIQSPNAVFTNGGTKLNIFEKQKAELREIARNDPFHYYTYSADYLSLSIDPYTPEEIQRLRIEENKRMWKTPQGFQTLPKKLKHEYNQHPKRPHPGTVEEMKSYPWYQEKLDQKKKLSQTRGETLHNGKDFQSRVIGDTFFSSPEVVQAEKISPAEKELQNRAEREKVEKEWNSKMVVDNSHFFTSTSPSRNSQLDRIRGILEDPPKKKGLGLSKARLKETTLGTTQFVQGSPISMFLGQGEETNKKNLFERNFDITKAVASYDFVHNVKQDSQRSFVYKPMKEIFPKV